MSSSQSKNTIISKETIQRLLRDVRDIMKNPLTENGIYYVHDDEDMLKGYALIIGPGETPYFAGNYFFELKYPTDYPHSPPMVTYCTNGENIRFNPNLYTGGKVCISLLNTWRGEQWTSCQTISTVLLNLCTLLNNDPILNEPGVTNTHQDYSKYNKIIQYKNIDIAILKILNKNPGVYMDKFGCFYPNVRENFLKNRDEIQSFLEEKQKEYPQIEKITTSLYGMSVVIDYEKLYKEFRATVEKCLGLEEKLDAKCESGGK
jgi:ubiquitin-conjugating enzyme E2 Z